MSKFENDSISSKDQTSIVNRTGTHLFENDLLEQLGTDVEAIADAVYFYNATKGKDYLWVDEDVLRKHERHPNVELTDAQKTPRTLHAYHSNMHWEGWMTYDNWYFEETAYMDEAPEMQVVLIESTGEAKLSYPYDEEGKIFENPTLIHGFMVFG